REKVWTLCAVPCNVWPWIASGFCQKRIAHSRRAKALLTQSTYKNQNRSSRTRRRTLLNKMFLAAGALGASGSENPILLNTNMVKPARAYRSCVRQANFRTITAVCLNRCPLQVGHRVLILQHIIRSSLSRHCKGESRSGEFGVSDDWRCATSTPDSD